MAISYCELLTGRLPYAEEQLEVVIAEKLAGTLDLSGCPRTIARSSEKATALDPTRRYRNCSDVVRELRGDRVNWRRFLKRVAVVLACLP